MQKKPKPKNMLKTIKWKMTKLIRGFKQQQDRKYKDWKIKLNQMKAFSKLSLKLSKPHELLKLLFQIAKFLPFKKIPAIIKKQNKHPSPKNPKQSNMML